MQKDGSLEHEQSSWDHLSPAECFWEEDSDPAGSSGGAGPVCMFLVNLTCLPAF